MKQENEEEEKGGGRKRLARPGSVRCAPSEKLENRN